MKRIKIISNDISFFSSLKFVKEKFPASVDYFIHSEDENNAEHKANFKRKSVLERHLDDADFIIPLFKGFTGVYLLQSLFSVSREINGKIVRIESLLSDYIKEGSIVSPEEFSRKNIFFKNAPNAPVFSFVLMKNNVPSSLNSELFLQILDSVLIFPDDFLYSIVAEIIYGSELPKSEIFVNNILTVEEITELEEHVQKYFSSKLLNKILIYLNIETNGEISYFKALFRLLKDINSDKFPSVVILNEQTELY